MQKTSCFVATLFALVLGPITAVAQNAGGTMRADSLLQAEAAYEGSRAARGAGTVAWLGTGFLGGLVAGPIGAGINLAVANNRETSVPSETLADLTSRGPAYVETFSEAYRQRVRSNRKTAAIVGGTTGTLALVFIVAQIANWGDGGGSPPGNGGGGEVP